MGARSTRVVGPSARTAGTVHNVYLVPANKRLVIKDWSFYNITGAPVTVILGLSPLADADILDALTAAGGAIARAHPRFIVLHAGEQLVSYAAANGGAPTYTLTINGMLVDAP